VKPAVRRVALIYNPASGQYSAKRAAAIQDALDVMRSAGVETEEFETDSVGGGTACAQKAIEASCDAVVACGGDGTVHEVVQSLVGTNVALGVIPLGTANALASDLGLLGSPVKVARALMNSKPVRVPVGRIYFRDSAGNEDSRYFIVAAGVGADALLGHGPFSAFSGCVYQERPRHCEGCGDFATACGSSAVIWRSAARTCAGSYTAQRKPESAGIQDAKPAALPELPACRGRGTAHVSA
jgi:hypothetical protein